MQERRSIGEASASDASSLAISAGGLIYVSELTSPHGEVRPGELQAAAETRRVLERLKTTLEAGASSLAQTVSVSVYLKNPSDFEAMNGAYREVFSDRPPARTTIGADLPDGALVGMSAVALPAGAPRETLLPSNWMKSPRPYSYIVRAGDLVFLSGLLSRRGTDDQVVSGPVGLQVRTILDNATTLLKTAGLTLDQVVAARVFITDDLYFDDMNNEYRKYFRSDPPARATVVSPLMGPDAKVEITLVASTAERRAIGPAVSPTVPVSSAIRAGNRLFLSGVVGNTSSNMDNPGAQARETLTRIGRTLEAAGLSFADVVDSTVYVTDLWRSKEVNDVYHEFFPSTPPARTLVGARIIARSALVEMMMVAVK